MGRKRKEETVESLDVTVDDITAMLDGEGGNIAVLDEPTQAAASDKPAKFTPEWHDYVMSFFQPDELVNGNPTTDGLRRVAQTIYGPFDSTYVDIVRADREHVIIKYTIEFNNYGNLHRYEDAAECHFDNTDVNFQKYLVATTTTRAEGRVLRKLLGLKKVIAAEEVTEDALFAEQSDNISSGQITLIERMCFRNNINVVKFMNSGAAQYDNINKISKETAKKMIEQLNVLQTDQSKIKEGIKGYDANWRGEN